MKSVEDVVDQLLETRNSVWMSSENLAVRAHKVESRGFIGISCTAYADNSDSHSSRQSDEFVCTDLKADVTNDVDDVHISDKVTVLIVADFLLIRHTSSSKLFIILL